MPIFVEPQAKAHTSPNRTRLFYFGTAVLLLALIFLGFQQFYLHGKAYPDRDLAPPIRTLIIMHGVSMTAWVLLFLIQPLMILADNRRVHMMLGRIGAALAASMVITGFWLGIESTLIKPPEMRLWGLDPKQFMAISNIGILIFAGFVVVGVWNRRRPDIHRPMMLLATLAAIPAATDRIELISTLYQGTVWGTLFGPFFGGLVIGLFFFVIKCLLTRSLDKWFAMGYIALVISSAVIMMLAATSAWDHFASYLLSLSRAS